eukprot:609728-Rhodomonas_salina.1
MAVQVSSAISLRARYAMPAISRRVRYCDARYQPTHALCHAWYQLCYQAMRALCDAGTDVGYGLTRTSARVSLLTARLAITLCEPSSPVCWLACFLISFPQRCRCSDSDDVDD